MCRATGCTGQMKEQHFTFHTNTEMTKMTQSKMKDDIVTGDKETGMVIERRFTQVDKNPFDQFDWSTSDFVINNPDGSIAFEIKDVSLPTGFEGVPGKVCAQKYMRKAGVPAALRKVPEEGVPTWLQRSAPDEEKLQKLDAEERFGSESDVFRSKSALRRRVTFDSD